MRVLILADPSSSHTIKWVNSLHQKGVDVFLFGLSKYDQTQYDNAIKIESLGTPDKIKAKLDGSFLKSMYLVAYPRLKKIIHNFEPDILHAHYAASYGLMGALTGFHPFVLSVWGIDILKFPQNSLIHKKIINFVLNKADKALATSGYLAKETRKYTDKNIKVTPFGIDTNLFKPKPTKKDGPNDEIVIGTVKALEGKYGIDCLIKSFSIIKKRYPDKKLKLLLIGGGSLEHNFRTMIKESEINDSARITGQIPFDKVVDYHNQLSIAVYVSTVESFGVSVLESMACEKPVIVSNVGGLPEVVENDVTGLIVNPNDAESLSSAIEKLLLNKNLREKFGKAGREKVNRSFNWDGNVNTMLKIYSAILDKSGEAI